jgi:hypothetical protein
VEPAFVENDLSLGSSHSSRSDEIIQADHVNEESKAAQEAVAYEVGP